MREIEFRALMPRCPEAAGPACIAYLDGAHPVPLGLRWTELDLVGRCVAWDNPGLPAPIPNFAATAFIVAHSVG
ncbi:hypothetical protein [Actinoallomurus acaciae]|uniref:Uncharacterized protein n=1 Tax=Actinoallomurus acaciae TaxID=502577 RepID=A0ABV5Y7Q4_9ACTN